MKVKDLIEALQALPEDQTVVLEADHGQIPMKVTWVGESHVDNLEDYMMDSVSDELVADGYESVAVTMIQAY